MKNLKSDTPQTPAYQSGEINKATTINKALTGKEDAPRIYTAEIITPQPYGIFALCKLMEHFQIN